MLNAWPALGYVGRALTLMCIHIYDMGIVTVIKHAVRVWRKEQFYVRFEWWIWEESTQMLLFATPPFVNGKSANTVYVNSISTFSHGY